MPDSCGDARQTHYEWLLAMVERADRRAAPFVYGTVAGVFERREWDIRNSASQR